MLKARLLALAMPILGLAGCAGLDFGEGYDPHAVTYYDPVPFLVVSFNKDCEASASVITMPDPRRMRHVKPKTGYGTANLTSNFGNGMLTSFGQTTDTKIPDSVPQLLSLAKAFGVLESKGTDCKPGRPPILYEIVVRDGKIAFNPVSIPAP
jgi:hypothetical protein